MSAFDILYVIIVFLVLSITAVVCLFIATQTEIASLMGTTISSRVINTFLAFDWALPFILFSSFLAAIISAYMINSHPAFFFVSLIVWFIVIMIAAICANVYWTVASSDALAVTAASFPKTLLVFKNLPFIAAVMGIIIISVGVIRSQNSPYGY